MVSYTTYRRRFVHEYQHVQRITIKLGIIRTGFVAVPVLAGSAAYAVGEALHWPIGLARRPKAARAIGTSINFLPIDPMRALHWSAVINGVMAAPIIVVMMKLATEPAVMAQFTLPLWMRVIDWITAVVMAFRVVGLFGTMIL